VDVIERIKSQLSASPVVLYMKGTPDFPQCGFSAAVVRALQASGIQFSHVNIFEDPEVREALKRYSTGPPIPSSMSRASSSVERTSSPICIKKESCKNLLMQASKRGRVTSTIRDRIGLG